MSRDHKRQCEPDMKANQMVFWESAPSCEQPEKSPHSSWLEMETTHPPGSLPVAHRTGHRASWAPGGGQRVREPLPV